MVKDVSAVCTPLTKSGQVDTLFYLVNYVENQGFAVLGSDPAVNDIYAIAPTGNLMVEDINQDPFLSDFFNDVYNYASTNSVIVPIPDSIKPGNLGLDSFPQKMLKQGRRIFEGFSQAEEGM